MKVIFTATAERNLERIGDYIAEDNPPRAMSFVRELREKALAIAETPGAYPLVPRYERRGVRRRQHGNYLILYTIRNDAVLILTVAHGAQDYGQLLFSDG